MSRDTWGAWAYHATQRHLVLLANGAIAELMAGRRNSRSCKIRLAARHYNCWVEDIVAVSNTTEFTDITWYRLDPWQVVDFMARKREVGVRPAKAAPSKSWLNIRPDPTRIPIDLDLDPSYHLERHHDQDHPEDLSRQTAGAQAGT